MRGGLAVEGNGESVGQVRLFVGAVMQVTWQRCDRGVSSCAAADVVTLGVLTPADFLHPWHDAMSMISHILYNVDWALWPLLNSCVSCELKCNLGMVQIQFVWELVEDKIACFLEGYVIFWHSCRNWLKACLCNLLCFWLCTPSNIFFRPQTEFFPECKICLDCGTFDLQDLICSLLQLLAWNEGNHVLEVLASTHSSKYIGMGSDLHGTHLLTNSGLIHSGPGRGCVRVFTWTWWKGTHVKGTWHAAIQPFGYFKETHVIMHVNRSIRFTNGDFLHAGFSLEVTLIFWPIDVSNLLCQSSPVLVPIQKGIIQRTFECSRHIRIRFLPFVILLPINCKWKTKSYRTRTTLRICTVVDGQTASRRRPRCLEWFKAAGAFELAWNLRYFVIRKNVDKPVRCRVASVVDIYR